MYVGDRLPNDRPQVRKDDYLEIDLLDTHALIGFSPKAFVMDLRLNLVVYGFMNAYAHGERDDFEWYL